METNVDHIFNNPLSAEDRDFAGAHVSISPISSVKVEVGL